MSELASEPKNRAGQSLVTGWVAASDERACGRIGGYGGGVAGSGIEWQGGVVGGQLGGWTSGASRSFMTGLSVGEAAP
ncbi:hypothetical protein [Nocardia thraciensis]